MAGWNVRVLAALESLAGLVASAAKALAIAAAARTPIKVDADQAGATELQDGTDTADRVCEGLHLNAHDAVDVSILVGETIVYGPISLPADGAGFTRDAVGGCLFEVPAGEDVSISLGGAVRVTGGLSLRDE